MNVDNLKIFPTNWMDTVPMPLQMCTSEIPISDSPFVCLIFKKNCTYILPVASIHGYRLSHSINYMEKETNWKHSGKLETNIRNNNNFSLVLLCSIKWVCRAKVIKTDRLLLFLSFFNAWNVWCSVVLLVFTFKPCLYFDCSMHIAECTAMQQRPEQLK